MFSIIVAHSKNKVIGKNNKIPWFLPSDLKRFKEITTGHKIIMGRKTFHSLPGVLPNREHLVLSRNENLKIDNKNVTIINDIEKFILENKDSNEEIFVIGGAEIYNLFFNHCKKLYITEILKVIAGDTFFLEFPTESFTLEYESSIQKENNIEFIYKNYSLLN